MLEHLIPAVEKKFGWQLDRKRYLLLGNAFSKFSVFLFMKGSRWPACIAKVPCNEAAVKKCENEYSVLEFLNDSPIANIRTAEPMGIIYSADRQFFLQEYVESRLLLGDLPLYRRTFVKRHFSIAVDRLSKIYESTREPQSEPGRTYSRCLQHGDFWLGNLGILQDDLVLYDLEFSQIRGKPLYDLLHFGIYFYRVLSNIGKYQVTKPSISRKNQSKDRRTLSLQPNDIHTVFGRVNKFSEVMYSAIFWYVANCHIDHADALELLLTFVERDRNVEGLPVQWEAEIRSTYNLWEKKWNET